MGTVPGQIEPAAIDYVAVFGFAALACLLSVARAREIEAPDVRRGLVWLLWTTGCWALFQIGFLVLPDPLQEPAYTLGLVLGFATVWAWLYFCSAYAGRGFHRNTTLRRLGAGTFLGVVAVKLTNPIHGLYFTTRDASEPFAHMAIEHGLFHWAVTGLSYVLATVGIFVLFELYFESGYGTRPLGALTGLLALPVTFEVVAVRSDLFVDMIYAPLGVAVFVIGVLFVYERRFLAVQSTGEDDDAVVFLDDEGRIRDVTPAAVETFPALGGAVGDPLADRLPDVAAAVTNGEEVVAHERDDETRYYFVSTSAVTLGNSEGTLVLFSDVTTAERRRRELDRHNTQLEGFANALAHELRNMLQIIDWRLALATDRLDEGTVEHESIESALAANERLADRVDDFTTLARYGQTVERFETVALGAAAENAWWHADTGEMSLEIDGDGEIEADPGRLQELFTNAFQFARLNGADTVTVDLFEDGFAIADDGEAPGEDAAGYLEFGESVPDAKSGMKLPNVRTFARVHGWRVAVDTGYQDGVRLVVDEVTVGIEAGAGNEDAAESEDAADRKGAAGADGQSVGHAEEGRS
ncbi:histidine kinase [Halobacteriales archaeon QH_2_66_30]|nr:MAG: histidine kinase [Halobacteriales archaeon QH_2_66_30]